MPSPASQPPPVNPPRSPLTCPRCYSPLDSSRAQGEPRVKRQRSETGYCERPFVSPTLTERKGKHGSFSPTQVHVGGAEVTRRRLHHPADGRCWCMTAYSWCFSSLFGRDFILLLKVRYLYIGRVWVKVLSYIASLGRGFPHSQRMKDNKCFACW